MNRLLKYFVLIQLVFTSCEEVIEVDLNEANPAFVAEGVICIDSVCWVRLSYTGNYFSTEEPEFIDDAIISLTDGQTTEELAYKGQGMYKSLQITGKENTLYEITILHNEKNYSASSYLQGMTEIVSLSGSKSTTQSIFNPDGDTIYTISVAFTDHAEEDNYYMIRFLSEGKMLGDSYYLATETTAVNGSIVSSGGGILNFSESFFRIGGNVQVQVLILDKPVYDYFMQLNDILFWKRRFMPPVPYNPESNWSNSALGYFSAQGITTAEVSF